MTLDQLRIFLAVADRQHVRRAADHLGLTQSAVSAAIHALEDRHKVALFHRVGRHIELSGAGRLFQAEAAAILARVRGAEQVLADLAGLTRGDLALAASQTIAGYWLPQRMVRFQAAHPQVRLSVGIGNSRWAATRVREGAADLALVEGPVDDPALASRPLAEDRLAVVIAPGFPGRNLPLAALPWVMREPGSGTRQAMEQALTRLAVPLPPPAPGLELPSNEAVRAAVEAGAGASILSELVVADSLALGRLERLPAALPPRLFHLLHHRERRPSRAAQAFLTLLTAPAGGERFSAPEDGADSG